MTGLVGYTDVAFKDIDAKAVKFLRRGLVWPIFKKLVDPRRSLQMFAAFVLAAIPTLLMEFFVLILRKLSAVLPGMTKINAMSTNWHWPVPRWYSRTHVVADAIADIVGRQAWFKRQAPLCARCKTPRSTGCTIELRINISNASSLPICFHRYDCRCARRGNSQTPISIKTY